ncbi:MAG TPA: hypothetical protein PLY93_12575, partial [Turneriella sp.]|nr:hypothetical protein [Turneriella sp.]
MKLIANAIFIVATIINISCAGGSVSFKKNRIYAKEDVCNPWLGKHDRYLKYKDYSVFSVNGEDLDTILRIDWDEWNMWYIILVVAPIPTYGFWKETSPAILNFEIKNQRKNNIVLNPCEILFFSSDAGKVEKKNLKSIPNCSSLIPIIIKPKDKKFFTVNYIAEEMNQLKQINLIFSEPAAKERIIQIIEIDDDWEY